MQVDKTSWELLNFLRTSGLFIKVREVCCWLHKSPNGKENVGCEGNGGEVRS